MTTIDEFSENLPNLINEKVRDNALEKLDPKLKERLFSQGGDLIVDYENKSFNIIGVAKELEDEIMDFFRSLK